MRVHLTLIALVSLVSLSFAQADSTLQQLYPFLHTDSNRIENDHALDGFYSKLVELKQGKRKQVKIVHIGDSHLQADFFSGEVRRLLQDSFGNAGRGFVFPYRAAKTNGPSDYRTGYYGNWESKRVVFPDQPLPIGLGGITLRSDDSSAMIYLKLSDADAGKYAFDKVTVFRQPGQQYYDLALGVDVPEIKSANSADGYRFHTVRSGENLGVIARNNRTTVSQIKAWNHLRSDMIRPGQKLIVGVIYRPVIQEEISFNDLYCLPANDGPVGVACQLPSISTSVYIRHVEVDPKQVSGLIYGISLENTRNTGVLYHTIGVNGAQYSHYCKADYFVEQVSTLNPDLIIFSLGTNESFATELGETELYQWMDSLVNQLALKNPGAQILLCSQPDTYKRRRYANERNLMIQSTIKSYAENRYAAFWDLNQVMGGYGSMNSWYRAGLTAKDKVHFSAGGYRIQGQLLFNALLEGYEAYRAAGHP
ncbi:MAG: LysM peptidoglycan-binding domain-containing protein [Bacteroidota bacterium]|nr:LysM peptidoglycan-binding domain-containing protein [Bacteroidota bacterium]MDX5430323.1 LysM peptidoglycan-binding domain-containing protein [Bacteroidota bacterium]MDX5469084.1 LysM peptidoglycan-binding domain-containing protein [Bacteroidota bacterium]